MLRHQSFAVEPWSLTELELDLDVLAQTESLFALSNGHLGLRGNLDEGEPSGLPGTYLNGVFETTDQPYAEGGYGYPEAGQTVINVTNGKLIRLLVDDEPFDLRYGHLRRHRRRLDLAAGTLERSLEWESPDHRVIQLRTTRLVSLVERSVAAIDYEVTAVDREIRIVVQSELVANEPIEVQSRDPRSARLLERPLEHERSYASGLHACLVHRTQRSRLAVAAAMDHEVDGPEDLQVSSESDDDIARVTAVVTLQPGERFHLVKYLAYGWSAERSVSALEDQVVAALAAARQRGWAGLVAEQRRYLDEFWDGADVEVEGDPEVQQGLRFSLFHVLQSGARSEGRAIPAKGLTGSGYDGHAFWDTEIFVLPVLMASAPQVAADVLSWRQSTLPLARERARQLGLAGATFPWRTIRGEECSGYWPAGTAAFHINADVAWAVLTYADLTGDEAFLRRYGAEILVETSRMWMSLGNFDAEGRFRIDGVTGPDEYSALGNNNLYTNLMAAHNLRGAARVIEAMPALQRQFRIGDGEVEGWRRAADSVFVAYSPRLGVHEQHEGYTDLAVFDLSQCTADDYPLMLHFPYVQLYRKQVVKQADLVLALYLCGEHFTAEQKRRNFAYYEALTVRDSSLSAGVQAVVAAEVGYLDLAYRYLSEAALMDIADLEHNTRDGLHIAALASSWMAAVCGLGGMRHRQGQLRFAPRLPARLSGLRFSVRWRDRVIRVTITPEAATYQAEGGQVDIEHHGRRVHLVEGRPKVLKIRAVAPDPAPPSPPHREPGAGRPGRNGQPRRKRAARARSGDG
jgi:alpha,alpha-trehalose phosphorylase